MMLINNHCKEANACRTLKRFECLGDHAFSIRSAPHLTPGSLPTGVHRAPMELNVMDIPKSKIRYALIDCLYLVIDPSLKHS